VLRAKHRRAARGADNRILDIVDNYEKISFNVGRRSPLARAPSPGRLREDSRGDRRSRSARGGHGNAIAQVYTSDHAARDPA